MELMKMKTAILNWIQLLQVPRARTALQITASSITVVAVTPAVTEKRGRGRPKGTTKK